MQVHGLSESFERPRARVNTAGVEPFAVVDHGGTRISAETTAECDVMIAAWTEAKRLLAGAKAAADLDHAIAADVDDRLYIVWDADDASVAYGPETRLQAANWLQEHGGAAAAAGKLTLEPVTNSADEGIEPESLYVVVEVDGGVVRATVTNPMPKAGAEQYARDYAHAHDGTLRVVPVADLDDESEPKADPVPWPTGFCGDPVPPGAWDAGFHYCRDHTASRRRDLFDEAAAPDLTVVDTPARSEDLDDADGNQ